MGIGIAVVMAIIIALTAKKYFAKNVVSDNSAKFDNNSDNESSDVNNSLTSKENDYDYVYTDQTNHGIGPYGYVNRNEYETMLIGLGCEEGIDTDSAWRPEIDGNSGDSFSGGDPSGGYDVDSGDSGDGGW